jgi:predicted Rdx family selenoprotein
MIHQQGSTNGFCFSESLIGGSHRDLSKIAVIPTSGGSFYAVARATGRRVAQKRRALGFWRLKQLKVQS